MCWRLGLEIVLKWKTATINTSTSFPKRWYGSGEIERGVPEEFHGSLEHSC
jgi:hypothetical protein